MQISNRQTCSIDTGWEVVSAPAGGELPDSRIWECAVPAAVPGTVLGALRSAAAPVPADLDADDWFFRVSFAAEPAEIAERLTLRLDGIASLADVWLNGANILASQSMFERHAVDVTGLVRADGRLNELVLACRSVTAHLRSRRRPRPRWRTRVVADQQLRWVRTSILGRAPGFAPGPAIVGPYRTVSLERQRGLALERRLSRATLSDRDGVIEETMRLRPLGTVRAVAAHLVATGVTGEHETPLTVERGNDGTIEIFGRLVIPNVAPWLPHTHGVPRLYATALVIDLDDGSKMRIEGRSVGFRTLATGPGEPALDGIALSVSGLPIFCRGVLWTPVDPITLAADPEHVRERLLQLRDAGVNMIRLPGTGVYEERRFHELCDELGILVWQDLMLANMDYPVADEEFRGLLEAEVRDVLERLRLHPSTAVICGGSEVEQQAAMMGLHPAEIRNAFIAEDLPRLAAEACPGVPVVPSSPCGRGLPFRTAGGISHYFGVGAYLRALTDARTSGVRFASECLAFANVPEQTTIDGMSREIPGGVSPTHPVWKQGVPRDTGSGWDFEDVRDHYLRLLYGVDPVHLRSYDPDLYLDLSRLVTGDVMAEVIGEWRRSGSDCGGGLVLQAGDLVRGAGWGLIDATGRPKPAYYAFRRASLPQAIWSVDEGLDGIDIHIANDTEQPLRGELRVALERSHGGGEKASAPVTIGPRETSRFGVEDVLGRFADAAYAYRFGPRGHDLIVASLYLPDESLPLFQHVRFIGARPVVREPVDLLGLAGTSRLRADGVVEATLTTERVAIGVRVEARGFVADDVWFTLAPPDPIRVLLRPQTPESTFNDVTAVAVNAAGRTTLETKDRP